MPTPLPPDYFATGVFAGATPGELFRRLTCVPCGHRSPTWARFRAHRERCERMYRLNGQYGEGPEADAAG
jgi:hypothetical protein